MYSYFFFLRIFFPLALPRRRIKSKNRPKGFWAKTENLTNFLTEFAQKHGFDPSDAEAWHNVGYTTLKKSPVSDYSSSLFFILGLNISDPLCFSMIGRKCNVGTFHGFSKDCLRHCFPRGVFPFQGYADFLWLDYVLTFFSSLRRNAPERILAGLTECKRIPYTVCYQ